MKRYTTYIVAALLLSVLALVGLRATHAQSVEWTGRYYVVVGQSADGLATAYGAPGAWQGLRPGPDLKGGAFVDFAVRPGAATSRQTVPYDLLAVGAQGNAAVSIAGRDRRGGPLFGDDVLPIPGVGAPHAVRNAGEAYLIVAARSSDGPALTGDYVVAYGEHGKWEVVPGPDFRGGTFVGLAVGRNAAAADREEAVEFLAIGVRDGQAVTILGSLEAGTPAFRTRSLPVPGLVRPVGIEWTGAYYVVMGEDESGSPVLVYGHPNAWSHAKPLVVPKATMTGFAVAPLATVAEKPQKRYDLLAVGTLDGAAIAVSGYEMVDFPLFDEGWQTIPGLETKPLEAPTALLAARPAAADAPYPNPFAQALTIPVTVAREQGVTVEVFNALGQRVALLHDGPLGDGPHRFTLDGSALPSGTYLLRVRGEDFTEVRSVTRMR